MIADAATGDIDLSEYAKKSDIPTDFLTEIPSEYITEEEFLDEMKFASKEQIEALFI